MSEAFALRTSTVEIVPGGWSDGLQSGCHVDRLPFLVRKRHFQAAYQCFNMIFLTATHILNNTTE